MGQLLRQLLSLVCREGEGPVAFGTRGPSPTPGGAQGGCFPALAPLNSTEAPWGPEPTQCIAAWMAEKWVALWCCGTSHPSAAMGAGLGTRRVMANFFLRRPPSYVTMVMLLDF